MVYKWDAEDTLLFLQCFENYPCLWDQNHDRYRDKYARRNAFACLISDMNRPLTEQDIRLKIKSIRTRFCAELHKIEESTKSSNFPGSVYLPSLYWFSKATFLAPSCLQRRGTSNFDISVVTPTTIEQGYWTTSTNTELETTFHSGNTLIRKKKVYVPVPIIKEPDVTPPIKKVYVPVASTTNPPEGITNHKVLNKDEYDIFFENIAGELRKMPRFRACICLQHIQGVMIVERERQISLSLPE